MSAIIYAETHSTDPAFNLAFEEYVLLNKKEGSYLMLWQNANTVVVGRNQNTAAEIDADFVRDMGVTVVRRMTGGGAVYHDLGNLNYTIIADGESTFTKGDVVVVAAPENATILQFNDIFV